MRIRRLLTLGPSEEPLWVRLYVRPCSERWAALIVADEDAPPQPDQLKGIVLFGNTADEAEQAALLYLGQHAEQN